MKISYVCKVNNHEFYLQKCLELAYKGFPKNKPNPMVGSIIVYNGKIIGEGYHEKYGYNHAEVNAINSVINKSLLCKSTLYVNLEPCSHIGKTPPCTDLIIKYQIPQVVIGCKDTHYNVSGKGISKMKEAGIDVIVGVMNRESRDINKRFFTFNEKKRPYIILKWAKSTDGFISPKNQNGPFWMTSNESKKLVHRWRSQEDSILVGRITVDKDNPSLTVRELKGDNPIRILIDRSLAVSNTLKIFNNDVKTIVFNELKDYKNNSNIFIKIDFNNMIDSILKTLYKLKIQSVIIEGGSKTLQSFIDENLWDEARVFTTKTMIEDGVKAPKLEGQVISSNKICDDLLDIIIPI